MTKYPILFSPHQKKGLIALIILCTLVVVSKQFFWSDDSSPVSIEIVAGKKEEAVFAKKQEVAENIKGKSEQKKQEVVIEVTRSFDPNKMNAADWQGMGIPPNVSNRIVNFIDKGRGLRQKEDLKLVYGFKEEWYNLLEPHMILTKNSSQKTYVNINCGVKDSLMMIKGVGEVLAERILKYKELVGGFYSAQQLTEVYGVDSNIVIDNQDLLKVNKADISKLNINLSSVKELSKHPYIKYTEAKALKAYQKQHGDFVMFTDLSICIAVSKETLSKIEPYIIFK